MCRLVESTTGLLFRFRPTGAQRLSEFCNSENYNVRKGYNSWCPTRTALCLLQRGKNRKFSLNKLEARSNNDVRLRASINTRSPIAECTSYADTRHGYLIA